jgi:hypothetical protein
MTLASLSVQKKFIQNGVNIQDGDFTFSHQPTLALYFRGFQTYKLKILIENYIKTNDTCVFFDKFSIRSRIELELRPSRIKGFFYYISFHHILILSLE